MRFPIFLLLILMCHPSCLGHPRNRIHNWIDYSHSLISSFVNASDPGAAPAVQGQRQAQAVPWSSWPCQPRPRTQRTFGQPWTAAPVPSAALRSARCMRTAHCTHDSQAAQDHPQRPLRTPTAQAKPRPSNTFSSLFFQQY